MLTPAQSPNRPPIFEMKSQTVILLFVSYADVSVGNLFKCIAIFGILTRHGVHSEEDVEHGDIFLHSVVLGLLVAGSVGQQHLLLEPVPWVESSAGPVQQGHVVRHRPGLLAVQRRGVPGPVQRAPPVRQVAERRAVQVVLVARPVHNYLNPLEKVSEAHFT